MNGRRRFPLARRPVVHALVVAAPVRPLAHLPLRVHSHGAMRPVQVRTMSDHWTLIPGDRVLFNGHEWDVFITPRGEQRNDSPIYIYRVLHPGQASDVIDLLRQRCELVLIPRIANHE